MPPTFHPHPAPTTACGPAAGLHVVNLAHLRLIRVAGADRVAFLQGQLTQDVGSIGPGRSALYGWTTAQGRLLASGQLFGWADALWLTVCAASADAIVRRLRMFMLRAKVTLEVTGSLFGGHGEAAAGPVALDGGLLPPEPLACVAGPGWCALRVGGDAGRIMVAVGDGEPAPFPGSPGTDAGGWHLADVRAGLPSIGPQTSDAFIPQMVNLDLVGGVSFRKGCYSGQEIIARTHHLGRVKRRMLRFACAGEPLVPGAPVFAGGREAGQVVRVAPAERGQELLAVTLLEALPGPFHADREARQPLARLPLPYRIPEAGD
jgi:folate-binding protein YgfZ